MTPPAVEGDSRARAQAGRTKARRLGGVVAGILVLGFLLWGAATGWSRVSEYEWHLDAGLLVGGVVVLFAFYITAGLAYVSIVERLGVERRVSRFTILSVWAKSLLGRYVPGNVLMVTGRVVLGREAGVPGRVSLAASVYEQTLLLTTAAVASLGFLAGYKGPGGVPWILLAVGVAAGLVLVHPRVFRPLSTWALRRGGREPLSEFLSAGQLAALFLYYSAANAMLGAGVWLLVRSSAGAEAGDLGYVGLAFLLSFVVGMMAFVFPAGLGVRDAAFALALGRNLPGSVAVAVSAGVRLVLTAVELAFVAAVVAMPRLADRLRDGRAAPRRD
jgi:glycosyltransferase 2 family protein